MIDIIIINKIIYFQLYVIYILYNNFNILNKYLINKIIFNNSFLIN